MTKTLVIAGDGMVTTTADHPRGAMLRAYDQNTGKEVGAVWMPAQQSGSPMTFMVNGKQYIIVAVSGGNYSGEYICYSLPAENQRDHESNRPTPAWERTDEYGCASRFVAGAGIAAVRCCAATTRCAQFAAQSVPPHRQFLQDAGRPAPWVRAARWRSIIDGHIWVAERCGANSCADSKLDPIMEFDSQRQFHQGIRRGMLLFPHGFFIDQADHIWVTDGHVGDGKGDDVLEFDRNGKLLRTLGKPGVVRQRARHLP